MDIIIDNMHKTGNFFNKNISHERCLFFPSQKSLDKF